jgi:glucose/arabinose dehydrogenase
MTLRRISPAPARTLLLALTLLLAAGPAGAQDIELQPAFPALHFDRPVDLQTPGDGTNRLFVAEEKTGIVWGFENDEATTTRTPFLDLSTVIYTANDEEGLLGLVFHPDYAENGTFYVYYSANGPRRSVLARYRVSDDDPNTAVEDHNDVLLEIEQPFGNHNGGQLAFGPDGYLYVALGDGGDGGDPGENAENPKTLLGSILRIDVDTTAGDLTYGIPPDNPFVGNEDGYREEIFAYGLRNPWRFSFDPETGWIWAADVGQGEREEIDLIVSGGNYGWDIIEGTLCYEPSSGCSTDGLIPPLWEYDHSEGRSITGGFVYRGTRLPGLVGRYIYADYVSDRIWALTYDGENPPQNEELLDARVGGIAAFGVDDAQDLYVLAFDGTLYRFAEAGPTAVEDDARPGPPFVLGANYPNPFRGTTTIPFNLTEATRVEIAVYDLLGRRVRTLLDRSLPPGPHTAAWDGTDTAGTPLPDGVYFYRLRTDNGFESGRRLVRVR